MIRYCLALFFIFLFIAPSLLAQSKFYTSLQYRSTQWNFISLVDDIPSDVFRSNQEGFKTLDVNIAAGKSWKVGLLMDIGDFSSDLSGLALRVGRKDWNFLFEKGSISGSYQATSQNSSITVPQADTFDSEYNLFAIYKEDSFINSGIAYLSYSAPLPTYFTYEKEENYDGFSYTSNENYIYIDSSSRMDVVGWYVSMDALKSYMQDGIPLFNFGIVQGFYDVQFIGGLGFSTPEKSNGPASFQNELDYKTKRSYFAISTGYSVGLMKVFDTTSSQKLGVSIGYQGRAHGAADISFAEPEMYTPSLDAGYFDVIHGFFVRASYMW